MTAHVPEELPLLDAVLASAGGSPSRRARRRFTRPGGSVGFGVDEVTVAQALLEVGNQAVGGVVAAASMGAWGWWRRRRLRRPLVAAVVAEGDLNDGLGAAGAVASGSGAVPVPSRLLTAGQVERLHAAVGEHGAAFGLPAELCRLFADALVGAMTRAAGADERDAGSRDAESA